VRAKHGVFDYKAKYTPGEASIFARRPLNGADGPDSRRSHASFPRHRRRDYARVDVMVRHNGEPVVLEVNTLPGMTELSILPEAAAAAG